MTSLIEYVVAEVLEGAINNIKEHNEGKNHVQKSIMAKNIFTSIEEDDELDSLFVDAQFKMDMCGTRHRQILPELESKNKKKKRRR